MDERPIECTVPAPWKQLGIVASLLLPALVVLVRMLVPAARQDPLFFLCAAVFGGGVFLLLLPCFIGRYPAWVVRLFGRQTLLNAIDVFGKGKPLRLGRTTLILVGFLVLGVLVGIAR